jgi:hypothetical protein
VTRRQHHRGKKRLKAWHRGRGEARRWARSVLPDVGSGADPTAGQPGPVRYVGGRKRGDAA